MCGQIGFELHQWQIAQRGVRPFQVVNLFEELKKEQVDLENAIVHIADSKTTTGIGDMPSTNAARGAFRRQMEETPGIEFLFPSPISTEKSRT